MTKLTNSILRAIADSTEQSSRWLQCEQTAYAYHHIIVGEIIGLQQQYRQIVMIDRSIDQQYKQIVNLAFESVIRSIESNNTKLLIDNINKLNAAVWDWLIYNRYCD